ncbi:MAG: hypothetical protein IT381_06225 [Deltaproteobacteria bacterium]|nr:hypothetical protein [Deltaproteobacteria bacterium]
MKRMLLVMLVACGPKTPADVKLNKPSAGFQLQVGPFDVPAGSELQDCYYFRVKEDAWVHSFQIAQNPGTHHMNMFRVASSASGGGASPFDDGQVQRGCWDGLPFQDWGLIVNAQLTDGQEQTENGAFVWTLPDGVATHLEAGELIMVQTHYVNATTQKTNLGRGKVVINFHTIPQSAVQAELGTMFANNRNIFLRAGEKSAFSSFCTVPQQVTIAAVSGHFHSRGKRFTVSLANAAGDVTDPVYDNRDWHEPLFETFGGNGPTLEPGGGLNYACEFDNPFDFDIVFGPHVEFEEHCNLFAYYYPRLTELGSLYCF